MIRMTVTFLLPLFFTFTLFAKETANALSNEMSPYLQQHADNPVHWYAWHPEVLQKAIDENKPIFLSIGYSTCHWCHVMEKESFTDKTIASLLNKYFISIKVDREELPHIDSYYQNIALQRSGKRVGWPLSVFMTPQKEVFYIAGYIPAKNSKQHEGFDKLLERLNRLYHDKEALAKAVAKKSHHRKRQEHALTPEALVQESKKLYQQEYSGFGLSRQFPEAAKIELLFDLALLQDDTSLQNDCFSILDAMALRGLYDHVDGGFFRYSVDAEWQIPHFEKMLYNQAELIALYTRAYLRSQKTLYKKIVRETIAMVADRLQTKEGLFYSAVDAQSDGQEGAYYTFKVQEVQKALKTNAHATDLEDALAFVLMGNFHNKVHISFDVNTRPKGFEDFRSKLQKIRASRNYPFVDKKINTAWNAMMIEALFLASKVDKTYAKQAQKSLDALVKNVYKNATLYHQTLLGKKATQKAFLEDYAFLIGALLQGYEVDFSKKKLLFAEYLLLEAKKLFYADGSWYLDRERSVLADVNDKYYTSAQGKMLQNIILLAALKNKIDYDTFAQKSLQNITKKEPFDLAESPSLIRAYLMQKYAVVIVKSSSKKLHFLANKLEEVGYPYIRLKAEKFDFYEACTLRMCFAKEEEFTAIIQKINQYKKRF